MGWHIEFDVSNFQTMESRFTKNQQLLKAVEWIRSFMLQRKGPFEAEFAFHYRKSGGEPWALRHESIKSLRALDEVGKGK